MKNNHHLESETFHLEASGMKFGFAKTLPHLIGIPLGHIVQIALVCFGLVNLFIIYPQIQFYMKIWINTSENERLFRNKIIH